MKQSNTVIICTAVLGFIVFIAGISLGWFGFPALIVHEIKQGVVLANGTEAYDRWRKLPVALYFKVYIFNVTNPDDVQNGANPVVQEVGPYVYDQYREKFDIKDEGDDTLSYVQNSTFYFNKEKSGNLSEDDVVTVLNIALVGTVLKLKKVTGSSLELDTLMTEIFDGSEKVFHTATVRDLTWDGVTVVNCTAAYQKSFQAKMVCDMLKPELPAMVTEHEPGIFKMAYFRHKNNSNDGRYRVNRGILDTRALGRIEEWEGRPNLTIWSGSFCNMINGTDSTIFPPFWSPKDKLYIFLVDVCRSLYATFESETMWKGLPALRYVGGVHNLEAAEDFPPNSCFCEEIENGRPQCLKSGVLNLYNCLGVSVIISFPHFYNASPDYQHYVQGLKPNKKKHETFIDIEPESGVILRGSKRMQMNIFLTRAKDVSTLSNVSEGLFPVVWIDEGAELDDKDLTAIHRLYTVICIFTVIKWFLVAAGVLLMCVSVYMFAFRRNNGLRTMQNEDKGRIAVFYDNKTYTTKHRDIKDTLSVSNLSDITRTDQADIRKRWGNFSNKSPSRSEPNKVSENVGLSVSKQPNNTVTLSTVFM